MAEDYYHIICLKRSQFADSSNYEYTSDWFRTSYIVYWQPSMRGYTTKESEAGLYSLEDIKDCCGEGLDWMIMRVPRRSSE